MNAKKIMGAVLVALLAAALFVGAGSAASLGTVFINQKDVGSSIPDGTWTYGSGAYVVTIDNGTVTSNNFVPGTYKNGDNTITVLNPTATFTVLGGESTNEFYAVGTLIKGDKLNITASQSVKGNMSIDSLVINAPSGVSYIYNGTTSPAFTEGNQFAVPADAVGALGEYTIQVIFNKTDFVDGTLLENTISDAYKFTVVKATAEITAAAETVAVGNVVKISITGKPNVEYKITGAGNPAKLELTGNNLYGATQTNGDIFVTLSNGGKAEFSLKANEKGTVTLSIQENVTGAKVDNKLTITIGAGTFTVTAAEDSYIIGETVVLKGEYTGGLPTTADLKVEGNNYKKEFLNLSSNTDVDLTTDGDKWELEITTGDVSALGKVDVGTYTFTIVVGEDEEGTSVDLTQPFLTAEVKTAVVVQGSKLIIEGTAEATDKVGIYIFGNNMFWNKTVDVDDEDKFKLEIEIDNGANDLNLATGQYFVVVQHKMYNDQFNVGPHADGNIYSNVSLDVWMTNNGQLAIKTSERQNANGAEALCQELDKQYIDDIYVKGTFLVDVAKATINPIPSEVTQGSKLTVSGTTNMGEGASVKVQIISAAFGAVPKEDSNAAAFITLTTKTDEDGNWEVTFDTSKLTEDDYTVVAKVADLSQATANVKVIAGAPTEQPTTQPTETQQPTTQPTETEAPTTPGFGALAALAGLGAVAVLLLRRE